MAELNLGTTDAEKKEINVKPNEDNLSQDTVYSAEELNDPAKINVNITDKKSRQEHAVRARINRNNYEIRSQEAVEDGRCPKCGGHLVLRNGKHGAFYGCSNYPNCKYTHPAI